MKTWQVFKTWQVSQNIYFKQEEKVMNTRVLVVFVLLFGGFPGYSFADCCPQCCDCSCVANVPEQSFPNSNTVTEALNDFNIEQTTVPSIQCNGSIAKISDDYQPVDGSVVEIPDYQQAGTCPAILCYDDSVCGSSCKCNQSHACVKE